MKSSRFIPFTLLAFTLILLTMPAPRSVAQEDLQLVIDNPMNDPLGIERDFKVTGTYTVEPGHFEAEATGVSAHPSLKTVNFYKDAVMEVEFILGSSQKAPICLMARPNSEVTRLYCFYLNPDGVQLVTFFEAKPQPRQHELGRHTCRISVGTPYRVKIRVVGENLAMKTWPSDETEPAEWQVQARDSNLREAGPLGIEIQRSDTPGNYSAKIRSVKLWIPKNQ